MKNETSYACLVAHALFNVTFLLLGKILCCFRKLNSKNWSVYHKLHFCTPFFRREGSHKTVSRSESQ